MSETARARSEALSPLLAPDEPPPFEAVNAAAKEPVLFVCDHASARIPRALGTLGLGEVDRGRHIACDIGAAAVTRALIARFDVRGMLANYSRLVIDLNRAPGDPTLIPVISDGTIIPGNRGLSPQAAAQRVETLFHPYHAAITAVMTEMREREPMPALISIHSFTPTYKGELRPWHVGVLWDENGGLALPFIEGLRTVPGICVGDNQPYSGRDHYAYTVDFHARQAGLPELAIEIRQDLVGSDAGAAEWAEIVGDVLAPILADVAHHHAARKR